LKGVGINSEKLIIAAFVPWRVTLPHGSPGVNPVLGRNALAVTAFMERIALRRLSGNGGAPATDK
jgi:hypothetical protein